MLVCQTRDEMEPKVKRSPCTKGAGEREQPWLCRLGQGSLGTLPRTEGALPDCHQHLQGQRSPCQHRRTRLAGLHKCPSRELTLNPRSKSQRLAPQGAVL